MRNGAQHHLHPTKRGWLFLGQHGGPCDKACKMCYYAYQKELKFFSLDTLISHANKFKHYYGLDFCDISGGEATIYGPADKAGRRPQLETLVRHCRNIGLLPTIITHGQNNTEVLVRGIEDSGLEDWLISLHGMKAGHEQTVVDHKGKGDGGYTRLMLGLRHITRPIRFNTTVQNFNYQELPKLAQLLADYHKPTVWNMIQFNPFFAWADREVIEFQSPMFEIAPYIARAIGIAEAAGWEVNVRYFPYCVAAGHGFAQNCVNFYGTQYDHWEWCLMATNKFPMTNVKAVGGLEAARRIYCDHIAAARDQYAPACLSCRYHKICEGPTEQYAKRYGTSELRPAVGEPITDVAHFVKGGVYESLVGVPA